MGKLEIRKRWIPWTILAGVLAALFCSVGFFCVQKLDDNVRQETTRYLEEVASQSSAIVRERIQGDLGALQGMASLIGSGGLPLEGEAVMEALRNHLTDSNFRDISVTPPDGKRHGAGGQIQDVSGLDYFQRALAGEHTVSDLLTVAGEWEKSIVLAVPIFREDRVIGVLSARYHESSFDRLLPVTPFSGQGFSYIATGGGEVFARSERANPDYEVDTVGGSSGGQAALAGFLGAVDRGEGATVRSSWRGEDRYVSAQPIGVNGWYLLSVVPDSVVSRQSVPLFLIALTMVGAVLLLCAFLVGFIIVQQKKNRRALEKAHMELKTLSDNIPGGVFRCSIDDGWKVDFVSEGFLNLIGYSAEEFQEKFQNSFPELIVPHDRKRVLEKCAPAGTGRSERVLQQEFRILRGDGCVKWIMNKSRMVRDNRGHAWYYCLAVDITETHRAQEELRYNQERYNIIISQTKDIVFEWNIFDKTIYHSQYFEEKFGYDPPTEDFPDNPLVSQMVHPDDLNAFCNFYQRLEEGENYSEDEFRIATANGQYIWCRVRATALPDENGVPFRAVGMITDIDDQKRETQKLEEAARHDLLTGLYNKGTAERMIQRYIDSQPGGQGALYIVDVDDFKQVNDCLGHLYGDAVLSECARSISGLFRITDIAGRIGGDEFAVFVKDLREDYDVEEHARRLSEILRRTIRFEEKEVRISGSVGVARYPEDGSTYVELYENADKALYYAKKQGKNQYAVYSEAVRREQALESYTQTKHFFQEDAEKKSFHDNISEYIFNLLYENPALEKAVPLILGLVGRHCMVSRAAVYERCAETGEVSNTYEWCAEGIPSKQKRFYRIPAESWSGFGRFFEKNEFFFCDDVAQLPENWVETQGEQSFLYCRIQHGGYFCGVVGFDRCGKSRRSLREEADILKLLARVLSLFLCGKPGGEESKKDERRVVG